MPVPNWTFKQVDADDILDGVRHIEPTPSSHPIRNEVRMYLDCIPKWVRSEDYLSWARRGLEMNDPAGWDIALCYAKRAVCRFIDSTLVLNHLEPFSESKNYPDRLDLLERLGIPAFDLVHDIIINPRNNIEHEYRPATASDARKAVQLATLLMNQYGKDEAGEPKKFHGLLLSIECGMTIDFRKDGDADAREGPFRSVEFQDEPMVLVDPFGKESRIMILHPKDHEVVFQHYRNFTTSQALSFAQIMRAQEAPKQCISLGALVFSPELLKMVLRYLGLSQS